MRDKQPHAKYKIYNLLIYDSEKSQYCKQNAVSRGMLILRCVLIFSEHAVSVAFK